VTGRRGSPTVRRRRLGAELRRYREAAGFTIDSVAEKLDCSASKISRLETGQTGASPRDVRDMLTLYQVGDPELEDLMEVARETRQRGWWRPYGSVLTGAYVGFEAAAQSIRTYEAQCIPGLLQTEDYARCLMLAARLGLTPEDFAKRVRVRMDRQALLTQDDPVHLWCVLDEAVLLRRVGGCEVMRAQLEHLRDAAELPNVILQVLPLDAGAHAGMDGSFVLLHFPDDLDPDTVYVAMATGGVFQEKVDELRRYETVFELLQEVALPPDESAALVASLAKESA
jgi:transcriptional regulator with XRE-family HTH domain